FVGLVVRHKHQIGLGARQFLDSLGKLDNRKLLIAADIVYFADCFRMFGNRYQCPDRVGNVRKAPGLSSIPEYRYVLSAERLLNEIRNHHTISPRLSWPNGVE